MGAEWRIAVFLPCARLSRAVGFAPGAAAPVLLGVRIQLLSQRMLGARGWHLDPFQSGYVCDADRNAFRAPREKVA